MTVQPGAETEVAAEEKGTTANASLDDRIARSIDAKAAGFGVTPEGTSEEKPEQTAETAKAATDDVEAESAEVETEEKPEAKAWTDDEMARFTKTDPKFFQKLDEDGWARVPAHWATAYKSTQAVFTTREQRLRDREAALEGKSPAAEKPAAAAKPTVNTAELVDALNDPERIDQAVEKLSDLPGFEKALDRYFEKRGIRTDALAATSQQSVFTKSYELAVNGDEARSIPATSLLTDETILSEIDSGEADPQIIALLKSDNEDAAAFGWRMAAIAAEARLARKGETKPRDDKGRFTTPEKPDDSKQQATTTEKVSAIDKAKQKVLDAKARANASTAPSAAVETSRRSVVADDDPKLTLDERIARNVDKKLQSKGVTLPGS
jgi:hypothetical protein